jgi:hypothetical protein
MTEEENQLLIEHARAIAITLRARQEAQLASRFESLSNCSFCHLPSAICLLQSAPSIGAKPCR